MKRAIIIALLALWVAQLPAPTLTARWTGDTLVVVASPGSLYLVGTLYGEQYVGQEAVTLKTQGGDFRYNPLFYERLELRSGGVVLSWLPIPEKPPRGLAILPIVVRP